MKPTIEQVNQWQDIIRDYHNEPIPMEELVEKCNNAGLAEVNSYLIANNYIARMKDGHVWINWSKNRFYEDATIINLKAQLTNSTRPLTLEERVEVLEQQMKQLLENRV